MPNPLRQPAPTRWPPRSAGVAEVQFSSRALASLAAQDDYLCPRNPAAADAVLAEVESLARLQAELPAMGRRIEGAGLRYHVTRGYR